MLELEQFEKGLNNNLFKKCYVFCGLDELLIKENIDLITNKVINENFVDLNFFKIDGMDTNFENIFNACETLPFMSNKKVVLVYRANFLKEKADSVNTKIYNEIKEYLKNLPEHCILIMYYLFDDKREKPKKNKKFAFLDKNTCVVYADKLKGEKFHKRVLEIFRDKDKSIGRIELRYFCDLVENNFNIIEREAEKLISYCKDRDITKKDIDNLLPRKEEDDIFDLVDLISQKKPEKAIDIMNELLNKGQNIMLILSLIATQFNILLKIKILLEENKINDDISKYIRRPLFVTEKLIAQSKKFSFRQINKCIIEFLELDKKIKSNSLDKKTELELYIMKTVMIK